MNPNDDGRSPEKRNVIVGLVVLVAITIVLLFWLTPLSMPGRGEKVGYSVYFPGQTTVGSRTRLVFNRRSVGTVEDVVAQQVALQLSVVPVRVPEVPQAATLLVGDSAVLDNGAKIRLVDGTHAEIRWNGAVIAAERADRGAWTLASAGAVPALTRNGREIPFQGGRVPLDPGDYLQFGKDPTALRVYWGDVGFFTRVDLAVDQGTYEKAAKAVGIDSTKLGPGTAVALLSGFGYPTPQLELRPSPDHGTAVTVARPAASRRDSAAAFELTPVASVDPLALLSSVTSFLGTPAGLRQPATNRIERTIERTDALLASVAGLTQQLDRAGKGEDPGVLLRLALDAQQRRSVDALLGSAGDATSNAARLAGTFDTALGDTTARGRLLHQLLGGGYGSLLATLGNARAATGDVRRLSAGLARDSATIDSTLQNVHRITATVAGNRARIDTTLRNVQYASGRVVRLDTTASRVGAVVKKAEKPALIAVVAGVILGLANGIKSLVH